MSEESVTYFLAERANSKWIPDRMIHIYKTIGVVNDPKYLAELFRHVDTMSTYGRYDLWRANGDGTFTCVASVDSDLRDGNLTVEMNGPFCIDYNYQKHNSTCSSLQTLLGRQPLCDRIPQP